MERKAALLGLILLASAARPALAQERPAVQLPDGRAEGLRRNGAEIFYGLPFAAAPIGRLRLAPPEPPASWTGALHATVPPAACPQLATADPAGLASQTEDCLYLNVFRPAANSGGARSTPNSVPATGG